MGRGHTRKNGMQKNSFRVCDEKFRKVGITPQSTMFKSLVVTKGKQTFAGIIYIYIYIYKKYKEFYSKSCLK